MKTVTRKLTRFFSKVLWRVITDIIKQLLRCFLESMQNVESVV